MPYGMRSVRNTGGGAPRGGSTPQPPQQQQRYERRTTPLSVRNKHSNYGGKGEVADDSQHDCGGEPGKPCSKGHSERDWVSCDGCDRWFHAACQGMSKEVLKFFSDPDRAYVCKECSGDVNELFRAKDLLKEIGNKIGEFRQEMDSVKSRVDMLEVKTEYADNSDFKEAVWEQLREFKADEEEIALRKPNLILQGVRESAAASPEEKYQEDLTMVKKSS